MIEIERDIDRDRDGDRERERERLIFMITLKRQTDMLQTAYGEGYMSGSYGWPVMSEVAFNQ